MKKFPPPRAFLSRDVLYPERGAFPPPLARRAEGTPIALLADMANDTHGALTGEVPIFYATTEGQTGRIAGRLARRPRERGIHSSAVDVAGLDGTIDWRRIRAAALGASLHAGRHQSAAAAFVRTHAAHLNAVPSVFFSVSLSAASSHPDEVEATRRIADAFPRANGWTPAAVVSIAGRLAYTQYGFLERFVMTRIARKRRRTHRHEPRLELTNWDEVDRMADEIAALVRNHPRDRPAAVA